MKTEHQDIIDRILSETLTADEEKEARELGASDVSFRKSLEMQYSLRQALVREHEESPLAALAKRESAKIGVERPDLIKLSPTRLILASRRVWVAVATILLLISAGFGLWQNEEFSNEAIAEKHQVTPPNPGLAVVGGQASATDLKYLSARNDFFKKDYLKARLAFADLVALDGQYKERSLYYLAHTDFKLQDYVAAKQSFEKLFSTPSSTMTYLNTNTTLTPNEVKLGRWNYLLTRLALGEDVEEQLSAASQNATNSPTDDRWSTIWEGPLKKDLDSFWR